MKVILLNDTSDWYHWGCTITSAVIKNHIQNLGYQLTSIPITEIYYCESTPETLAEFKNPEIFAKFSLANFAVVELIKSADIVVINGEGTLHSLSHGARTLLYLAYLAKIFLHKPTQIINHSVYPQDSLALDNAMAVELYQHVYKQLDFIAIRETWSANLMQQLSINVTQSFDCLPLFIKHYYQPVKKSAANILVIAGSGAWFKEGLFTQFQSALTELINYINKMIKQRFIVQILTGAKSYPARDDKEFIAYLQANQVKDWTFINATSSKEWLDTIAQASLLVSGRFHHTIAAACLNTPFIAFKSNTPKIDAILSMFGTNNAIAYQSNNLLSVLNAKTTEILQNPGICFSKFHFDKFCELSMANFIGLENQRRQ